MFSIYKVTSNRTIDYAAEELAKYLRMMMPEGGAAKISYHPTATDGFRIGLMEDFGLEMPEIQDSVDTNNNQSITGMTRVLFESNGRL